MDLLGNKKYRNEVLQMLESINPNQDDNFVGFVRLERMNNIGHALKFVSATAYASLGKFDILAFYKDYLIIIYNERLSSGHIKIPHSEIALFQMKVKSVGYFNPKRYEFKWIDNNKNTKATQLARKKEESINRLTPKLIEMTENIFLS